MTAAIDDTRITLFGRVKLSIFALLARHRSSLSVTIKRVGRYAVLAVAD